MEISVTGIKPKGDILKKKYQLNPNNDLVKVPAIYPNDCEAETFTCQFEELPGILESKQYVAIMPAYPVAGFTQCRLVSEQKLEQLSASNNSTSENIISRTKDNFKRSSFIIFDIDTCLKAPENLKNLSALDKFDLLARENPEFRGVKHFFVPSSSNGITYDGRTTNNKGSGHIYVLITNADDIPRFLEIMKIRLMLQNLSWNVSCLNNAKQTKYIFDMRVFSENRLFIVSDPILEEGVTRDHQEIEYHNGKAADLSLIPDLSEDELKKAADMIGVSAPKSIRNTAALHTKLLDNISNEFSYSFTLDSKFVLESGETITAMDFISSDIEKHSIFSPFRKENHPSAVLFRNLDGIPFIHDSAIGATVFLDDGAQLLLGFKKKPFFDKKIPLWIFPDVGYSNGKPRPLATQENLKVLLDYYGVSVNLNLITKNQEISIPGESFTVDSEDEAKYARIISLCEQNKLSSSKVKLYVTSIANQNPVNPVTNWIKSKEWDGVDRISALFSCLELHSSVSSPKESAFLKSMFTKWMVSAALTGTADRGRSCEDVLVLVGGQGVGKTMFLKSLCPLDKVYLKGASIDPSNKDSVKIVASHWIVELGEIDATFKKADIANLKAYLSNDEDKFRPPYAQTECTLPRRTAFAATVNEKSFLRDETGNRRFIPIEITSANFQHSIDMQQAWSQALTLGEDGVISPYHTKEEQLFLEKIQKDYEPLCVVEEKLLEYFDFSETGIKERAGKQFTATQIAELLGLNADGSTPRKISNICRKLLKEEPTRKSQGRFFNMPKAITESKPGEDMPPFNGT